MRKIIFSTGNLYLVCNNIYDKIENSLKLDVDGVELLFANSKDLINFKLKKDHKKKLRKLKFNTIHVPFFRENKETQMYFWNDNYSKKVIKKIYLIAKEIDAVNINFHAHQVKNPKVLKGLHGMHCTFENMTQGIGFGLNDYKNLFKDNPKFDMLLDTSHGIRTGLLKDLVKTFKKRIKFIHLSGATGPKDDHYLLYNFKHKNKKQLEIVKKLKCPIIIEGGRKKGLTVKDFQKEVAYIRKWLN
jgi:hypothetical protein